MSVENEDVEGPYLEVPHSPGILSMLGNIFCYGFLGEMKTLSKLLLLVTLGCLMFSCSKPKMAEEGVNEEPRQGIVSRITNFLPKRDLQLPLERTLVDSAGRSLAVEVMAKKNGFLAVRRLHDDEFFSIEMEKLGNEDQRYFSRVPESSDESIERFNRLKAGLGTRVARWNSSLSGGEFEAEKFSLPTYLLFTGTSWCPPCQALESSILNTSEFRDFANKNLVLVKVDIPRTRVPSGDNRILTDRFSISSYPTVILLSPNGEEIKRITGFSNKSPGAYVESLGRFLKIK